MRVMVASVHLYWIVYLYWLGAVPVIVAIGAIVYHAASALGGSGSAAAG